MPEIFSYAFLVRAAISGCFIALASALLGTLLVQKRFSMIGDGLSHVGFGTLAIAAAFGIAPLHIAIPAVIVAAIFMLKISSSSKMKGDASTAIISTTALALGVMVVSLSSGINTDLYNYMFGSILALKNSDVLLSAVIAIITVGIYCIFYKRIFTVAFDEDFAYSIGIRVGVYNMIIAVLTAITVVLGMRMMGTLLISGLIIFPALTAAMLSKSFKGTLYTSAAISVLCFLIGLCASYYINTPTGASVILTNASFFVAVKLFKSIKII